MSKAKCGDFSAPMSNLKWFDVFSVPLSCWCKEFFKKLGGQVGDMVKARNRAFQVRLKEHSLPVPIAWVNDFLGLKPRFKNLKLLSDLGRVVSNHLIDENEHTSSDDSQLEGDISTKNVRGRDSKEKRKSSDSRWMSELGKRRKDKDYLFRKLGDKKKEVDRASIRLEKVDFSNQMRCMGGQSSSSNSDSTGGSLVKSIRLQKSDGTYGSRVEHRVNWDKGLDENLREGEVRSPISSDNGSRSKCSKALEVAIYQGQEGHENNFKD
ncbi:hypothetical protein QYF36_004227 [Acer negundo]|nr:hypothetical protein QYF36_004227 [Acer negundo]